jgi:hypothetical protein
MCRHSLLTVNCIMPEQKKTPWSESESELCRPSGRHLSAKLVLTFADRGCHVVSMADPYGRILGFLDRALCLKANLFAITTYDVNNIYNCKLIWP